MEEIERIRRHPLYVQGMEQIRQAERERIYCKHGPEHALDVARIAYILNLEETGGLRKECIYAMALLHDLGRADEYADGIPHHQASAALAARILKDCGYPQRETDWICGAIGSHNQPPQQTESETHPASYLRRLLYRADKLSRRCYDCSAKKTCYWTEDMRNQELVY